MVDLRRVGNACPDAIMADNSIPDQAVPRTPTGPHTTMPNRKLIGLVHNPRVPETADLVRSLVGSLDLKDSSWVRSAGELELGADALPETSVIITAGGDGTILRVARLAAPHQVPILGINMGRVGFMTELSVAEAADRVPSYLNGNPRVEERMMLRATVTSTSGIGPRLEADALNDVVVARGSVVQLLDIEATVDDVPLTSYRADALIIATPTGSTGYALSAAGPIISPETRAILMQPLAAHMSFPTGLVVPEDSVIKLRVHGKRGAAFSADNITNETIGPDDVVVVKRSPHVARFLRAGKPSSQYARLDQRLGLNESP